MILKTQKTAGAEHHKASIGANLEQRLIRLGYDIASLENAPSYQRRMEEELRRQRSWLETTLRFAGDGIVLANRDERVCFINDAALAMIETEREAVLGRALDEVLRLRYHWSGLPVDDLAAIAGADEHPVSLPLEIDAVTATGSRVPVEGFVAACRIGAENCGSMVLLRLAPAAETAREESDEYRVNTLASLAGHVAASLDGLQDAIQRCAGSLDQGFSPSEFETELRDAATEAASVSARLRSLIRQSGQDAGRVEVRPLIEKLIGDLRLSLPENVALDASYEDEDGAVRADAGPLAQILFNVVSNAGDSMPDGGAISIVTSRAKGLHREDFLSICVHDTSPEISQHAFEYLFETLHSTKKGGGAEGLGFTTAHAAISRMGGFLFAYFMPEGGTTVEILFPTAPATARKREMRHHRSSLLEESEPFREMIH